MNNHITLAKTEISTPIGLIVITTNAGKLISIEFANKRSNVKSNRPESPIVKKVTTEIQSYFKNPKHAFGIEIDPLGTELQKKIWQACQKIMPGKTKTYSDLANEVGTSPRVVGNAMRKNPFPIIIPCHRVIAKNGLGGFSGERGGTMLEIKQKLLEWEKN